MAVTIKDIARHSGVSVSTVSRVLNKKPDVNTETEVRVNSAIKELGYSPSSVARGLVLKRSNAIGFVVPDITNPSFPELARGVVEKARQNGYSVIFLTPQIWMTTFPATIMNFILLHNFMMNMELPIFR